MTIIHKLKQYEFNRLHGEHKIYNDNNNQKLNFRQFCKSQFKATYNSDTIQNFGYLIFDNEKDMTWFHLKIH